MTTAASVDVDRAGATGEQPRRWRRQVDRLHATASAAVLGGMVLAALAWPGAGAAAASWGGAALLVGGALIGVPHGSSDFVVAHRALEPLFGRTWLPLFLVGYLSVVAAAMLGWRVAPLATLLAFIVLSGLHFAHGDVGSDDRGRGLALAVRAATPLLPVLLIHPASVTGLIAGLGAVREPGVARVLDGVRWPMLWLWAATVSCYAVPRLVARARGPAESRERRAALEVGALALAAVTLPPLLAFALYFCVVHAVRHMIGIADDHRPHDARRAALLAAAIVVPSASVCLAALAVAWNGIAGPLGTEDVLAWSLRLIAALTGPHMALEAWTRRTGGGNGPRPPRDHGPIHRGSNMAGL